jgi:hypothetical protein
MQSKSRKKPSVFFKFQQQPGKQRPLGALLTTCNFLSYSHFFPLYFDVWHDADTWMVEEAISPLAQNASRLLQKHKFTR